MKRNRMDSHQWDSALDPEVVPLFPHVQWAQARALQEMRQVLLRHGLSVAEFDVLATLRNAPAPYEMTPPQIQQDMVITWRPDQADAATGRRAWSSACRSRMTGGSSCQRLTAPRSADDRGGHGRAAGNQWPVDQAGADGGEMAHRPP